MGICAGIDLCNDHIALKVCGESAASVYPAVICREKKGEKWYIGEEAYRVALSGEGVMTDKLLKLLMKDGTSTVMRKVYTGSALVSQLIRAVLEERLSSADFSCIDRLCVTLHKPDLEFFGKVKEAVVNAGIPAEKLILISHEEAFVYYTLSREKDLWSGMVGMFDLCDESLCFYEMMMVRGMSRKCVVCESRDMEEAFHTDILRKDSGKTLGDRIMTDIAKRNMEGRAYSALFLTGNGFDRTDWAEGFLGYVCRKRKVLQESGLFAIGASMTADDAERSETQFPELIFCDGRTTADISLSVTIHERDSKLILARAGSRWFGLRAHVEVAPEGQDYIGLLVESFDSKKGKKEMRSSLASIQEITERPERCSRIAVDLRFVSAERAELKFTDLGFGELFAGSGRYVEEELIL